MAPRKRGIEEIQESPEEAPQRDLKTQKTDAKAQAAADSNSDSSYVSAAAAVFSENEDSEDSASSHDQSDSELSTSSEEPSSDESESEDEDGEDDDEEDRIINVRPGGKPQIRKEATDSSLLKRLKSFLPEMHEANEELEKERADGTLDKRNIEDCDEGKQHIEMVSHYEETLYLRVMSNCIAAEPRAWSAEREARWR